MNHIFKVIWCDITNKLIVVSELASSRGKKSSKNIVATVLTLYLGGMSIAFSQPIDVIESGLNNITIENTNNITTDTNEEDGIFAQNTGLGNIEITNKGNIVTEGDYASAIYAHIDNPNTEGRITIINSGDIRTKGHLIEGAKNEDNGSYGISAIMTQSNDKGEIYIQNTGSIETQGVNAHSIYVANDGAVTILNSGKISNQADKVAIKDTAGIYVTGTLGATNGNSFGDTYIQNTGEITASEQGIRVNTRGNVRIDNSGEIYTSVLLDHTSVSGHAIYISPLSNNSRAEVNHSGKIILNGLPLISGNAIGIAIATDKKVEAHINVESNGVVDATHGAGGIQMSTAGNGSINLSPNSVVNGGVRYGIYASAGNITINNAGELTAMNDKAINFDNTKSTELNNSGIITGYITTSANSAPVNFDNSGIFNLRNQIDSTFSNNASDYFHDTKKVAISKFNGGNITNNGIIQLVAVEGLKNNSDGEYIPNGAKSSSNEGIQHAQLLDVKNFQQSGMIDLTGSGLSGNVLIISGGSIAGNNGNGVFVTNGGTLKLSTTVGGKDSHSDVLVVDNIKKGNESTKVDIVIASGSKDEPSTENGIKIVETLGTQDPNAFELLHPVTYGRYEYFLYDHDANGTENGYYLRNQMTDGHIALNPNVGAYLGNQYAAANMFNQNILDRRDNVRYPDQTTWGRIQYNEVSTNHMSNSQKLKIDNTLIQLGIDLYQDQQKGRIAGVYVGYGKSDITNTSHHSGSKANGSVDGFQVGAYYSWMPLENQGPYVDVWGYYATYRNKLKGDAQRGLSKKYNGNGFAVSAEAGYGFIVSENQKNKWILEPHAQVTYNYIDMDSFTDANGTRFSNNKAKGFDIRLGARLYGHYLEDNGVLPFVELNWLHNGMDNTVLVNESKENSRIGKNIGELKLGFKGNLSKESSIFAHVGLEKGKNKYKRTKLQIGFNYNW